MLTNLAQKWNKKYILILIAVICLALFFFGQHTHNSEYVKYLATLGGLSYALHNLVQLAQ
jgi:hypothetical protein